MVFPYYCRRVLPLCLVTILLVACSVRKPNETPVKIDADSLEVRLEANGPFPAGGSIGIRMTVSNPTTAPRTFCRYHTPFEGIRNDIFLVSSLTNNKDEDIEYGGMMVKRAPPGRDDFLTLAPGASRTATVDLSQGGYGPLPPGGYAVRYRGTDISGLPMTGPIFISVTD
jgi:peptidyl-Lys metalloendopeptidase